MFWRGKMHFITWHISSLFESMVFWFDTWWIWTVIFFWWMYGKLCLCCRLLIFGMGDYQWTLHALFISFSYVFKKYTKSVSTNCNFILKRWYIITLFPRKKGQKLFAECHGEVWEDSIRIEPTVECPLYMIETFCHTNPLTFETCLKK